MLPMTTDIQKPYDVALFRIIRSADMPEISKTNKKGRKYREEIKNMLIKRDLLSAVRLDIFESARKSSKRNSELLKTKYGLDSTQIYRKKVSLSDGWKKQIRGDFGKLFPELSYKPLQKCPVSGDDLLKQIQNSDIFLNDKENSYHDKEEENNFNQNDNELNDDDENLPLNEKIISRLNHTPISIEDFSLDLKIPINVLNSKLIELEIEGKLVVENG